MNWHAIPTILTAVTSFFLGVLVYLKGKTIFANRIWSLLSFCVGFWSVFLILIMNAPNEQVALWCARAIYFSAIPIPILFYHFLCAYLGIKDRKRNQLVFYYIVSALFFFFNFTNLFIKGVTPLSVFRYFGIPGNTYFYFLGFWTFLLILSFKEMVKGYQKSGMLQRNQIKYILIASIVGFSGGSTAYLPAFSFIPGFSHDLTAYGIYGHYFVCLYAIIISLCNRKTSLNGHRVCY